MQTITTLSLALITSLLLATVGCATPQPQGRYCDSMFEYTNKCLPKKAKELKEMGHWGDAKNMCVKGLSYALKETFLSASEIKQRKKQLDKCSACINAHLNDDAICQDLETMCGSECGTK